MLLYDDVAICVLHFESALCMKGGIRIKLPCLALPKKGLLAPTMEKQGGPKAYCGLA